MGLSSCCSAKTVQRQQGKHIGEYCSVCDRWIKWVPGSWRDFIWPVGSKHKGEPLPMVLLNDRKYLEWAAENMTSNPGLMKRAKEALESTKGSQPVSQPSGMQDTVDHIARHVDSRPDLPSLDDGALPW